MRTDRERFLLPNGICVSLRNKLRSGHRRTTRWQTRIDVESIQRLRCDGRLPNPAITLNIYLFTTILQHFNELRAAAAKESKARVQESQSPARNEVLNVDIQLSKFHNSRNCRFLYYILGQFVAKVVSSEVIEYIPIVLGSIGGSFLKHLQRINKFNFVTSISFVKVDQVVIALVAESKKYQPTSHWCTCNSQFMIYLPEFSCNLCFELSFRPLQFIRHPSKPVLNVPNENLESSE